MSGDVALLDDATGSVSRLVTTASRLFRQPGFGPAALVGGLGVIARVAAAHRATADVDTVVDGDQPRELAVARFGVSASDGRIEIEGVVVDVMATSPLPGDSSELPEDESHRLFVLAHRWALESAEALIVRVVDQAGEERVRAGLPVAIAPALLACKLHAIGDRRGARAAKQESDARDIVRLTQAMVDEPSLLAQFSAAPFDLVQLVSRSLERWLVDGALRSAHLVNVSAGVADVRFEPAEIETLGRALIEYLPNG